MKEEYLGESKRYRWQGSFLKISNSKELMALVECRLKDLLGTWYAFDEQNEEFLFSQKKALASLPDPFLMKDMEKASLRIAEAIFKKEKIAIFADYDVDGITSSSMLRTFLRALDFPVMTYIPERASEGYGMNVQGVESLASLGISLIVTVDNGISAVEACQRAKELGVDVIITDHHDIPPQIPQNVIAMVNPKQKDCSFPYKKLAGVGVAFYLMVGLRRVLRERGFKVDFLNLRKYLDFVAVGTVADMVPLDGLNHVLVKIGLEVLRENILAKDRLGFQYLCQVSQIDLQLPIDASDIGFKLGPRLNAAGRLGSALMSEQLLYTCDEEEAQKLALALDLENQNRRALEKEVLEEALASLDSSLQGLVVAGPWNTGVVGLVASRLVERFGRPAIVLGHTQEGVLRGSGRSIFCVNLFEVLGEKREWFEAFGGHEFAVGLTIKEEHLKSFGSWFHEKMEVFLGERDLRPFLHIDGIVEGFVFSQANMALMQSMEPFGMGHPKPRWLMESIFVSRIDEVGDSHLRFTFDVGGSLLTMIWFKAKTFYEDYLLFFENEVHVVFETKLSTWRGKRSVDYVIVDMVLASF